jgi:hypothetical protein
MSTIVTRAGKGSALTHNEVDANFVNLNTDKLQSGSTAAALTITSATINGGTITGVTTLTTSGNTILGDASTDTLNVGNGGLVKDASGNVGIGTASPTAKLTVNGNQSFAEKTAAYIGVDIATTAGNGGNLTIKAGNGSGSGNTSGNLYVGAGRGSVSAANGFIAFGVAQTTNAVGLDAEYMRLDSSGNLGIGNATPTAKLDIYQPSVGTYFLGGSNNVARQLAIKSSTTTNDGDTHTFDAQSGTGVITFATTSTERMRINSTGVAIAGALSFASFLGGLGKTGSFIRNSGGASGTQAITGVGFRPSTIIFFAAIDTVSCQGIGFTDATNGRCVWIDNVYGSGGASYAVAIYYLRTIAGNGASHTAVISSMDADGFTLNWTRTNIGSGGTGNNIIVNYLAFR